MTNVASQLSARGIEVEPLLRQRDAALEADTEQRLRELLHALPAAIYTTDALGRITFYNDAAAALWGCRPKLDGDQWCGSWRLFWPDGTPLTHDQCPMAIALRENRAINGMEAAAERPDGTRVPFMAFPSPLRDADGKVRGGINMLVDISERKRAEEIAGHFTAIVECCDDAVLSKDLDGIIKTWNRGAERLFGYTAEETIGRPVTMLIPADRLDEEPGILARLRRGERIDHYETVRQRKDGGLIDISLTVSPVKDSSGRIIGASKIARDITERKQAQERIALLAREVDHRSKNLLALVQATVHLTKGDSTQELKAAIEGRIQALANAHSLLSQSRWAGADLRGLVMEELAPYCHDAEPRVRIEGPTVALEPNTAQSMAVAVHELATNAVKYGALSLPTGRVLVEWSCASDGAFTFRWSESGGPPVVAPAHRGFGTRVLERLVRGPLKGDVHYDWRAEGLLCEITAPELPRPGAEGAEPEWAIRSGSD
jgi:two-component system CheB/CheR fusion protein